MEPKTSFKWSSFIISIVGIAIFSVVVLSLGLAPSGQGAYTKPLLTTSSKTSQVTLPSRETKTVTGKVVSPGLPVRLKIKKINVDAPVIYVGLTPEGAMDVGKGPYDVAWFNLGPRPGQTGSAVMAGHFGIWKNGAVSVFHNLNKLATGDIVTVEDDKGVIISFVVRESKLYYPKDDATAVFRSIDGKSHLNFVTCVYDSFLKKYTKRLVVFTDKIVK